MASEEDFVDLASLFVAALREDIAPALNRIGAAIERLATVAEGDGVVVLLRTDDSLDIAGSVTVDTEESDPIRIQVEP